MSKLSIPQALTHPIQSELQAFEPSPVNKHGGLAPF